MANDLHTNQGRNTPRPRSGASIGRAIRRPAAHTVRQVRTGASVGRAVRQPAAHVVRQVDYHSQQHAAITRANVRLPRRAHPGELARAIQHQKAQEVRQAQQQITKLLHAPKQKIKPFGLSAIGSGRIATERRQTESTIAKQIENSRIVYDGRHVFRYHPPGHVAVQKNVDRLFHGSPDVRTKALHELRNMGIVTGGNPSKRFFEYLGSRPYTRAERTHIMEIMTGARKGKVTPGDRAEIARSMASLPRPHYPLADAVNVLLGQSTFQKEQRAAAGSPADNLRNVAGFLSGNTTASHVQQGSLLPFQQKAAQVVRHGLLSGSKDALGVAGDVLDRPLAAVESGVGKSLVHLHVITNPKSVQKISHARNPLQAFLHGRQGKDQGVSGGDIVQGLGGPKQLGIGLDLVTDPVLWIGLAALPETGGASSALIAERIAAKGGADLLKSPRLLALADRALKTRHFGDYEAALREVARAHDVKIPRNIIKRDAKVLREIRSRPTHELLHSLDSHEPLTVTARRGLLRRTLGRPAKQRQFHVIGKEGMDAVTNVARTVQEGRIRPGFRVQMMLPTGRRTLPRRLGGRDLPSLSVPLGETGAKMGLKPIPLLTKRAREFHVQQETARIETEFRQAHEASIAPLERQLHEATLAHDSAQVDRLGEAIASTTAKLDDARLAAIDAAASKARRQRFESVGAVTDRSNAVRLQRNTSQFAQDFGRTVQARLDQSIQQATATEGLSPAAAARARERVQLSLWAREGGGAAGEGALHSVIQLTPQEERIKRNLIDVFDHMLRQGRETGIMGQGVLEFGGSRIWSDKALDPKNVTQVQEIIGSMIGRHGVGAAFSRRRTAPSVFDLADPSKIAKTIRAHSDVPISEAEARKVADQLWDTGRFRTHTELVTRKLQRGLPVHMDELHPEAQYQVRTASRMTPAGSDREQPLLNIDEQGFVKLHPASEQHYGIQHDPLAAFPQHEARLSRLRSAMRDRARVQELLKIAGKDTERTKALRMHLADLEDQIKQLDTPVRKLPKATRDALKPDYAERTTYTRRVTKKDGTVVLQQVGTDRLPKDLMASTVMNDHGVAWIVPSKGMKVPPGLPPPRFAGEAGVFDDPLDYMARLPNVRETDYFPVLDPRVSNFYRTRAQGRAIAYKARWEGIDAAVGRSSSEALTGRYVTTDGATGSVANLKATDFNADGHPVEFLERLSGKTYRADELHFPEPTLLRRGDRYYYDPVSHTEYMRPEDLGVGHEVRIGQDRLWPTQTIQDAAAELRRDGEFDGITRLGIEKGWERALAYARYGVTTPFPAYHLRNLYSDLFKSLQADSGVMFHPIVNAKLLIAATGKRQALHIPIPGHGTYTLEDFLMLADVTGLKSGHHVSEVYKLISNSEFATSRLKRYLTDVNPLSPNSFFGQMMTRGGVAREDWPRFMTFMQRMRSNGGDAADAAMYMIRHHFNYNDLSAAERRIGRNLFLFYTWYRKNIPLQLVELVRRPGFFSGVMHGYTALENGETPINQDWSKISPWLPDMSGEMPQRGLVPDYYKESLLAAGTNWNGHAVMVGFGAPWADLQLMSAQGLLHDVPSFTNPVFGFLYELVSRKDLLTGRHLKSNESSGIAKMLDGFLGISLPKDSKGDPILPFWVNSLANRLPLAGRAAGSFLGVSPFRDQGRLSRYGRAAIGITGLNIYVSPKKGSERERAAYTQLVAGRAAERAQLSQDLGNLTPHVRDKKLHEFDHETLKWARDHKIPKSVLHSVQGSGFYTTIEDLRGQSGTTSKLGHGKIPGGRSGGGHPSLGGGTHPKSLKTQQTGSTGHAGTAPTGSSPAERVAAAPGGSTTHPAPSGGGSGAPVASGAVASADSGSGYVAPHGNEKTIIKQAAAKWHVDPGILYGIYGVETGFGSNVANSGSGPNGGAKGPFQFEDATAASYGVNVHSFASSAEGAAHYIHDLLKQHGGNIDAALNSYSGGAGGYASKVKGYAAKFGSAHLGSASGGGSETTSMSTPNTLHSTGKLVAPSIKQVGGQVDESAAILDALLQHKGGSLLKGIIANIDSGAYTTPITNVSVPGQVPKITGSAGKTVNGQVATGRGVIGRKNLGRVDQGVDFTGSGPVQAVVDGTVTRVVGRGGPSGWPGGGFIVIKLKHPPDSRHRFIYIAENISPTVHVGQRVRAGQKVAHAHGAYPFLETGWAADANGTTLARATTGYSEGQRTSAGKDFLRFLGL